jgi:sulfatase maturation enzyme AslB (radical SAM superfamily)
MRIVETAFQKKLNPTAARPLNGKERFAIPETAFGSPRDFIHNRFVYAVISARARGLSLGVNLNPDKHCNFNCLYCEVDRRTPPRETRLDVDAMAAELHKTLVVFRVVGGIAHPAPRGVERRRRTDPRAKFCRGG